MSEKTTTKVAKKRKISLRNVLLLQIVFVFFSMATVCAKLASSGLDSPAAVFTPGFLLPAGALLSVLGVYAIIWQQIIKHFELSVVYANRATVLLWTLLWGVAFFDETITPAKVVGIIVVYVGVNIMNSEEVKEIEKT
ncbi:MAG: transporter [Lachnospiraceae bacterium]|jgi:drug/metabolite transporter (DMT)-like permease|nr:transporter [Lachnospiraceae bacterium]